MADPTDNNYWVHWNVIDIPATTTSIAQGVAGTPKCPGVRRLYLFSFSYSY